MTDKRSATSRKPIIWIAIISAGLVLIVFGITTFNKNGSQNPQANLVAPAPPTDGFERADRSRAWDFPTDLGPHPEYQTEWWYYTGNLESEEGVRFGYQLTFFRRALLPATDRVDRGSVWGTDQVYMAHFALSDISAGEHHASERFSRGAAGLAGAQSDPYRVWLEDWQVIQTNPDQYQITVQQGDISVNLILEDQKGPILHGDQGYSQKGPEVGNASYYYSQTRLQTTGIVATADGEYSVRGLSWKDHEFSTSALSEGQVGWDWFSIQLDDGSDLMFFQIRREDGSIDPFSSGTWVGQDGATVHLQRDDFQIEVEDTWQSPDTGAEYPSAWTVRIPSLNIEMEILPYMEDQEMNVSYDYWEGAVRVRGERKGETVGGNGYVEMTGYSESMRGDF